MKQFLHKRWRSIPVGIISAVMVVCLVAGGALAAYGFLNSTIKVNVVEAIAVGVWPGWDNLEPYGSGDLSDVNIDIDEDGNFTITTAATETPYGGEGFAAGEWIVIPLNIRNGSSVLLNLSATVTPDGNNPSAGADALALEYLWKSNTGTMTEEHPDGNLARDFKASGAWETLDGWEETIPGYGGESGSARIGALVLFVRVNAPGDVVPGAYTYTVTLERS